MNHVEPVFCVKILQDHMTHYCAHIDFINFNEIQFLSSFDNDEKTENRQWFSVSHGAWFRRKEPGKQIASICSIECFQRESFNFSRDVSAA